MSFRSDRRPLLISDGLHAAAARWPGKIAIVCEGVRRSYGELAERVRRICGAAQRGGVRRGTRVALIAPNCIEYPELLVGLTDAGAVVATLNPRSTAHEVAAACDDCGAELLFAHPSVAERIGTPRFATVRRIVAFGAELEAWMNAGSPSEPLAGLDDGDPFALVYSSGTTGKPKGILLSHGSRSLTFHAMAMEYGCYGPDDLQLGVAPMAHGAGFAFIMASLYFGGTVEIVPKFDPALVVEKLAREPFTGVFLVPTHFQSIFGLPAAFLEEHRGRCGALRTIMSNASALPYAVKERIVDYWGGGKLHETYGSTEASIVTNLRPQYQLTHPGSVGPSFALNHVRLLDDHGGDVPRGEVGELFSRSPYLFSGYWGTGLENGASAHDGWVSAGDLARQDEDGFFSIVDRKKDMVITGGLNVYPREIEEVLQKHPAVLEAAVIGVPDEYYGEALVAVVAVRTGMNVEGEDLQAHCRVFVGGYKVPKRVEFVGALPRNLSGKILKGELRQTFRAS